MKSRTLHQVAADGNLAELKQILQGNPKTDLNEKDENGNAPIHVAVINNREMLIEPLIVAGVSPDEEEQDGLTPLYLAAMGGYTGIINKLIELKADPNREWKKDGSTPLHAAAESGEVKAIEMLIKKGANPNSRNHLGDTPLHQAVRKGNIKAIKPLIGNGANCNEKNDEMRTPLHLAVSKKGATNKTKILIELGAILTERDSEGWTPLHLAALNGRTVVVNDLIIHLKGIRASLDEASNDGDTALHLAALNNHSEVIEALIAAGASCDKKNKFGNTPLHKAIFADSNEDIEETVRLLIKDGKNINEKNNVGETPLDMAVKKEHTEVFKILLAKLYEKDMTNSLYIAVEKIYDEICDDVDDVWKDFAVDDLKAVIESLHAVNRVLQLMLDKKSTSEDQMEALQALNKNALTLGQGKPDTWKRYIEALIALVDLVALTAFKEGHLAISKMKLTKLFEKELKHPIYMAMKKIYEDAEPLWKKGSKEDKDALKESLRVANRVVQVMLDNTSAPEDKADALQALEKNSLTLAQGKPSTWKKFVGALIALVGVVALIAGIVLTGGVSLVATMCVVGSLFAAGGVGFFAHGMQSSISKDLSQLHQVALKI